MNFFSYLSYFSYFSVEHNYVLCRTHPEQVKNDLFERDGLRYFYLIFSFFLLLSKIKSNMSKGCEIFFTVHNFHFQRLRVLVDECKTLQLAS